MTLGVVGFLLDFLIVGLLMTTISYCWVLNKRIKILQDGKSELAALLKHFDESTARASESIVALQTASKKIGENIQNRIDKVNYLIDDLNFLIEKGNKIADQLDANFAVNRARSRVISEDVKPLPENYDDEDIITEKTITRQPDNLEKPRNKQGVSAREKATASLEAVLDRVAGKGKSGNSNISKGGGEQLATTRSKPSQSVRSKAEQELLEMIRAGVKG